MKTSQNTKSDSTIEQQLNVVRMSQQERKAVSHDARIAELFVNAIVWVCSQAQRMSVDGFANPSPKY